MDSNSLSLWQSIRLKFTLWGIPPYVLPRASVQYLYHKFFCIRCPSQVDIIRNSLIRWLGSNLDYQQHRIATSPPKDIYGFLDTRKNLLEHKATISKIQEKEFDAFWIPCHPDSQCTIFYIHGGGFTSGSTAGCAKYLIQMASELCSRGLNCSILSIDYDLSPEARYPTALRQISVAYSYALSLGKPIVLFGDSAGGHLCLSLLRHIHIPHPHIQAIRNAQVPDLLVLVSPWVDLKNNGASVRRNAAYDCLDKPTLDRWSRQYMGSSGSLDVYTDHLNNKAVWEGVLPRRTLMIAGEFECFVSGIRELAGAMVDDHYEGLELLIEPLKCHDWPAVDFAFGIPDHCEIGPDENNSTKLALKGLRLQVDWILKQTVTASTMGAQ